MFLNILLRTLQKETVMLRVILATLVAAIVSLSVSNANAAEDFAAHHVEKVATEKVATPVIAEDSLAAVHKTVIVDVVDNIIAGKSKPLLFGGKYIVVEVGNGTLGGFGFLVDIQTGKVILMPYGVEGFEYRADSTLLVVNPEIPEHLEGVFSTEYWVLDEQEGEFVQLNQ